MSMYTRVSVGLDIESVNLYYICKTARTYNERVYVITSESDLLLAPVPIHRIRGRRKKHGIYCRQL